MKKIVIVLYMCLAVLLLTACLANSEPNQSTSNHKLSTTQTSNLQHVPTITQLSSHVNDAIEILGYGIFSYRINHSNQAKSISIWFDKYEDGGFVESLPALTTTLNQSEGALIYLDENEYDNNETVWTLNIKQGEILSSSKVTLIERTTYPDGVIATNSKFGKATFTWNRLNAKTEQSVNLGYLVYDIDKTGSSIDEDLQTTLANNKLVYVLKAQFE